MLEICTDILTLKMSNTTLVMADEINAIMAIETPETPETPSDSDIVIASEVVIAKTTKPVKSKAQWFCETCNI
ncbi:hypothetical protein EBU71_20165, partial [bacterium]|nr:hypothetical protein [Candidatus Elulimicrobium humile]